MPPIPAALMREMPGRYFGEDHVAVDDLPFGGIGPSGMGQYHDHERFLTMSNAKSILSKGRLDSMELMYPPYRGTIRK